MSSTEIDKFIDNLEFNAKDKAVVRGAAERAEIIHSDEKRESGEPYFNHLFETVKILTSLGMGPKTLSAGFLHDSLENNKITREEIKNEFGEDILFLVDGVTKLSTLKYTGLKRHVESLRKFFMATSKDPRIIIIKLADRLHNMETLGHLPEAKQKRIALETMEIYAPLAHRLGIGKIKGRLEDLAFFYLDSANFKETREKLGKKAGENTERLDKILRSVKKALANEGITDIKTDYRVKHTYSLYKKLRKNDMDIDKIYDISSLRIIVKDTLTCYQVLGIIHSKWQPLPMKIKDYIAFPKPNGYRSLHTTVFTGDGGFVEIQIRTEEMHNEAEYGLASHISYKEGKSARSKNEDYKVEWLRKLAESQKDISRSDEFLKSLRNDFFDQRIFVFTPKGDVIELPAEASPLDFAYAIHSDIGDHTFAVKVNSKMVSLDSKLLSGDVVEIQTRKGSKPSRRWLEFAKTTFAKKKIRASLIRGYKNK